ncbi:MAG: M14 family zinc carboxypeptidase, partial [Draconibacterium sp.]|nr:M14 family zinc carboxypeptidase [Draconibacterium sp.]
MKNFILFFVFLSVCSLTIAQNTSTSFQKPSDFFGFQPGEDRMLFNYDPLIEYLQKLADQSPRVAMEEIGESPMGKKMYLTFFSSEENINNLENLKAINKELALNAELSEGELKTYTKDGKVFVLAALSMHSTEVGPSQSAPLLAYEIATTNDPKILGWLDNVVYMIIPSHNPDGMDMVVDHYMGSKGTKYEGGSMPQVYHKYVGHDNNRDFVTLTQKDNKAVARVYNTEWYPQVMTEKHQM